MQRRHSERSVPVFSFRALASSAVVSFRAESAGFSLPFVALSAQTPADAAEESLFDVTPADIANPREIPLSVARAAHKSRERKTRATSLPQQAG